MPVTARFDPTNNRQAFVIPDATPTNDGVMSKAQAAKLAGLSPGGGALNVTPVRSTSGIVAVGEFAQFDFSGGNLSATLPPVTPENKNLSLGIANATPGMPGGNTLDVEAAPGSGDTVGYNINQTWNLQMISVTYISDGVSNWILSSKAV